MERASIGRRLATAALCACLAVLGVPATAMAQDDPAPDATADAQSSEAGEGAQLEPASVASVPLEASDPEPTMPQPQAAAPRVADDVLQVEFNGGGASMADAIVAALSGRSKADFASIIVTGRATEIGGGDWEALRGCYAANSDWANLSSLDLSGLSDMKGIGASSQPSQPIQRLKSIEFPPNTLSNFQFIGDNAFYGCTEMEVPNKRLPKDVSSIGEAAFAYCSELVLEYLPSSVATIGPSAFRDCSKLEFVGASSTPYTKLPSAVTSIGDYAFLNCPKLVLTALPGKITSIGNGVFQGCSSLALKELPAGVKAVGEYAFEGCTGLAKMTFPSGFESVGEKAFSGCTDLLKLSFHGEVPPSLSANAFAGVGQGGTVYCPDADRFRSVFGVNGPSGWTYASSFTLEVEFNGDGTSMSDALAAALAGRDEVGATDIKVFGDATDIPQVDWVMLKECYREDSAWTSLSGLNLAGMNALKKMTGEDVGSPGFTRLENLVKPDSLETVGSFAFALCENMVLAKLPDGLFSIEPGGFRGCESLDLAKLPDGIKTIDDWAFAECKQLKLSELPADITSIGDYAFAYCDNLPLAKLPAGVESIGTYAFLKCYKLALSELPVSLETISRHAFFGCTELGKMTFPRGLAYIGEYAFLDCANLTELSFLGDTPPVLGTDTTTGVTAAFYGVPAQGALYYSEGAAYAKGAFGGTDLKDWGFFAMTQRTLVDPATGVRVSGVLSSNAALLVEEGGLHAVGTCAACDAMRARESEGVTLAELCVSLAAGCLWGGVEASFPVGAAYDDREVAVLHCAGGTLEEASAKVAGGFATGAFSGLSPFAVVAPAPAPAPDPAPKGGAIAKTGDGPGAAPWLALASVAVLAAAGASVCRKRRRR
ncbi:hypothetical protein C1878_14795 [Gordonibacter sp. 28C]|uniref:leucine-rich repeat domain-containing protein n=1 Tax=Gordonibacter sp. 28C TaxID=2078569 RepID=UPI000DF73066|nr:leucine-rich repeat domain-containing protein [Gordonibacter sp. 28C]RDB59937.1 hypothetical protein C1878_14795 [Gordonibacter sp. 28C]